MITTIVLLTFSSLLTQKAIFLDEPTGATTSRIVFRTYISLVSECCVWRVCVQSRMREWESVCISPDSVNRIIFRTSLGCARGHVYTLFCRHKCTCVWSRSIKSLLLWKGQEILTDRTVPDSLNNKDVSHPTKRLCRLSWDTLTLCGNKNTKV